MADPNKLSPTALRLLGVIVTRRAGSRRTKQSGKTTNKRHDEPDLFPEQHWLTGVDETGSSAGRLGCPRIDADNPSHQSEG